MLAKLAAPVGSALLLLALVVPAAAVAAERIHERISGSEAVDDFCGSGKTIDVEFQGVQTVWLGDDFEKLTVQIQYRLTNPLNGNSVREHGAGQALVKFIEDEDGGLTVIGSNRGMVEHIKLANGGLLTRDVGLLRFVDHFDADGNYLGSDVEVRGPHPELDSDFTLYCEVMAEALDL
jgi:hypothetical protein